MATTTVAKIKVTGLSKYGFNAEGYQKGLYYSKNLKEDVKAAVVPGAMFDAELYTSDAGAVYLNKIVGTATVDARDLPTVDVERAKRFTPKFTKKETVDNSMSKDEWAAKDRRISRQGCIQVAVQVQSDFDEAAKLADKMLEYVNQ